MLHFDQEQIESLFSYKEFIPLLKEYFTKDITSPHRPHYPIENGSSDPNMLLLMPAWQVDEYIGIKLISIFKENPKAGLETINGIYVLMSGKTGLAISTFDAATITAKRTAATSALASSFLAREDSKTYTMLGTGKLSTEFIHAHHSVFEIETTQIWGRNFEKAQAKAAVLSETGINILAVSDKSAAISRSDIVSAATFSKTPIIFGKDVKPGTHIDLVGSYLPDYREADDDLIKKATVVPDTEAALAESGDLVIPLANKIITESDLKTNLIALCKGESIGRSGSEEITCFKSVGYALEDLAIAVYLYQKSMQDEA